MGAACDAHQINRYIQDKGRFDLIDFNKRRKSFLEVMSSAEKERYKIRSSVERTNPHLKDYIIPDKIYVKGFRNMKCTLMIAVLCLTALKILLFFHLPEI